MAKIILLADNDAYFLRSSSQLLEDAGYTVLQASSPDEARKIMEESHVHLAILDIRLRDDNDSKDLSGIQLAKEASHRAIPKIIITEFPSFEYVRATLGPSVDGLPSSVNFLAKADGIDGMIAAIEQAFRTRVQSNEGLQIEWAEDQPLSFPGLVGRIEKDLPAAKLSGRVAEIEDLLRQLFYSAQQVILSRQLWSQGDRTLLEVLVYSEGSEESMLLTVGLASAVGDEQEQFSKYAPHTLQAGNVALVSKKQTVHYAATTWSPISSGEPVAELSSLSAYYVSHTEKQVRSVLENLFENSLKTWMALGQGTVESNLAEVFQSSLISAEGIPPYEAAVRNIGKLTDEGFSRGMPEMRLKDDMLEARFADGQRLVTANPLPCLYAKKPLPAARAMLARSLGGLDPDTLLVDKRNNIWLSDFAHLGNAPAWLDAASLEAEIRFRFVDSENFLNLHEMEKMMLEAARLSQSLAIDDIDPDFHKPAACIQTIRNQTAALVGDALTPFEICLLFASARPLLEYDPEKKHQKNDIEKSLYRLLFCGLLCEKLSQAEEIDDDFNPRPLASRLLSIDEANHQVRVGERVVDVSLREYDLLLYLYRHRDQLCKRADILRDVFGVKDTTRKDEESLLNTNISRLRKKIEPDPELPIFLQTVRGIGFKLMPEPD